MRNIVSMVLVAVFTLCIILLYHLFFGISTINEFSMVVAVFTLCINLFYVIDALKKGDRNEIVERGKDVLVMNLMAIQYFIVKLFIN